MPKGTKVLMVDDDKMLLDMYKERLELAGYNVVGVTNGEECLAKIQEVKPDIVLLDIMMPKINGYDTLASIKSDPATKDTPVIILSALVRDINKSKAVEAGADDYIIKSEVMPADVIKKIETVLGKYHKDIPQAPAPPKPAAVVPPAAKTPAPKATPLETPPRMPEGEPPPGPPPVIIPFVYRAPAPDREIEFEPLKKEAMAPSPLPPAPPAPFPAAPQPKPLPKPVAMQPVAAPQPVPPPPLLPTSPPPLAAIPTVSPIKAPAPKASPLVVYFLILIVILILASDIFFYLKFLKAI